MMPYDTFYENILHKIPILDKDCFDKEITALETTRKTWDFP